MVSIGRMSPFPLYAWSYCLNSNRYLQSPVPDIDILALGRLFEAC